MPEVGEIRDEAVVRRIVVMGGPDPGSRLRLPSHGRTHDSEEVPVPPLRDG